MDSVLYPERRLVGDSNGRAALYLSHLMLWISTASPLRQSSPDQTRVRLALKDKSDVWYELHKCYAIVCHRPDGFFSDFMLQNLSDGLGDNADVKPVPQISFTNGCSSGQKSSGCLNLKHTTCYTIL